MVMTLHKLTAGDGYLYLVRQVAAGDNTQRGRSTLADYYSAKGEAPGRWMGRGLSALFGEDADAPPPKWLTLTESMKPARAFLFGGALLLDEPPLVRVLKRSSRASLII